MANPIDADNTLLEPCPALLSTTKARGLDGAELLALTIRTTSATLTVMLNKADAAAWSAHLAKAVGTMSGLALAAPVAPLMKAGPRQG